MLTILIYDSPAAVEISDVPGGDCCGRCLRYWNGAARWDAGPWS